VKQLDLAASVEGELSAHLTSDGLENVVAAFDGFGREICRVHASRATNSTKAQEISFQNLSEAQKNVQDSFGIDLSAALDPEEWKTTCRCFQKRHLLAHHMGIVDEKYVKKSGDPQARVGRKVSIDADEVRSLISWIMRLGRHLALSLKGSPTP
jgi:hypothetical protein